MTLKRCGTHNEGWQVGDSGACYAGPDGRLLATRTAAKSVTKDMQSMSQFDVNRTLFMFDDFCQETAQAMVAGLLKLDAESNDPINIVINSYGGSVSSLFSILDVMGNLNSQINTICMGEADSCGAVLLAAGDFRYIGSNSRTMIHEISTMAWGKVSEIDGQMQTAKEMNDRFVGLLARYTGQDKDKLAETMKQDTFLSADESVKMGLVDCVLDTKNFISALGLSAQDRKLVASARSRTKDALITDILASKIQKGGESMTIIDQLKNILTNYTAKGDEIMKKEELVAVLKSEHGVDLEAVLGQNNELTAKLSTLEGALKDAEGKVSQLSAEFEAYKQSNEDKQIEELLGSLIDEGKSSQKLNDTIYRAHFKSIGFEAAKEVAKALPVAVKLGQVGTSHTDVQDDVLTDSARKDQAIQAIAKEKGLNYSDAEKEYVRLEREKKGV